MPDLTYEVRDLAAWITIRRPERRNALSQEAIVAFVAALDSAEKDDSVRVICVTGEGDKVFCSGADLASAFSGGDAMAGMQAYADLLKRMAAFPKPFVARAAGHCLAGGLGLLLSCDLAIAREDSQFWTPELDRGLFPMMIGALIFRSVPRRKALEMIYTGRRYSAAEAVDMGLVTCAVPADDFDAKVSELLATVAAKAPLAMSEGRRALAQAEHMQLGPALDLLCQRLGVVASTEDAAEGMMAFLQKRKPEWRGR
ncbi:MAG: enoyl-CoA hydratase-related protein [Polyangia bacterium]|jgi:enoyl-CoA hydratase/carnithine racemase|nr:enoyl-CoA hydratase-related protein [Polyangia bacterium]